MRAPSLLALVAVLLAGCATYRDELARGQAAFEQNQHEVALAIFRPLEQEQDHLTPTEQARYAYLRGMTDYRIGYRAEARHWLLIADQIDRAGRGLLPKDWKRRMDEAIADLDQIAFDKGAAALSNDPSKSAPGKGEKAELDEEQ